MELIEQLKREGYEVRFRHERATPAGVELALELRAEGAKLAQPSVHPRHVLKNAQAKISPHGGRTIAIISLGDQEVARGEAVCAPTDNFNRRVGQVKALGRAVSELRKAGA